MNGPFVCACYKKSLLKAMSKIVGCSRVLSEYGEEYKVTVPYGHHTKWNDEISNFKNMSQKDKINTHTVLKKELQ